MAGSEPERAMIGAIHRTIPNATLVLAVATTASLNLGSVAATEGDTTVTSLLGKWVLLEAVDSDVRVMRKASGPIAWPRGTLVSAGAPAIDFYVDREGLATLQAVAEAAASLLVHYDTEQK